MALDAYSSDPGASSVDPGSAASVGAVERVFDSQGEEPAPRSPGVVSVGAVERVFDSQGQEPAPRSPGVVSVGAVERVFDSQGQEPAPRSPGVVSVGAAERVVYPQGQEPAPLWTAIAALGRTQDGVFGVAQLRELGLTDRQLGTLVREGRFVRRHRGVYADAVMKPTQRSRLLGALLAFGEGAFLSRRTALAVHGVRLFNPYEIEVTIVSGHTPRHPGLVVHRTRITPDVHETRTRDGLLIASPSLALVETAARETPTELDRLVAELDRRRLLDLHQIDAALDRRRGLPAIPHLRAALARYRPPTGDPDPDGSGFERAVAEWLAEDPAIPSAERNVRIGPWEVDFHWPDPGVVVETDGAPYHRTPQELERDRVKDAWLQCHGQRVLRVTEFRFRHDRAGIRHDLRALLARA